MKQCYLSLLVPLFCTILSIPRCDSQTDIQIQCSQLKFDSLKIQAYDEKNTFKTVLVQPFQEKTSFKSKTPLEPGIYWIFGDSSMVDAFLISSDKNQKFSIFIDSTQVTFQNSPENSANQQYIKDIREYDRQTEQLNQEFQKAQNGGIPSYMMQVFRDSLVAKALRVAANKEAFQWKTIQANKGTLLATIIQATIAIKDPPQELYQDRNKIQAYIAEHYYDNFPWQDTRIYKTSVCHDKITEYCRFIYQLDRPDLDTFVVAALNASKTNIESYYLFFDKLEKVLGSNVSPYKVEHTYIEMLKDALATPNLEKARKARYERELKFIDINRTGSVVPNFNIVLSNQDTTNLYAISCDYMILYLEHPTCPTCTQARNRMANYPALNNAISNGNLKVLTVYFENDPNVWNTYIQHDANPDYLHGWNYDQTIEENGLFDTRTIPYMFLLDKDKRVIKKDLLINEIEDYIHQLGID